MKTGKILLVGIGPGAHEHMTFRAREAIKEADVVIGYSTYIKLVADLLVGKEVIKKGMTEELDRSVEAYYHAQQGKIVALVSSGDIGVYGMAGPTYEFLLESGWTPESEIKVEVIVGSTALSSCAALVGAPLTHDFCAISLSDLLTPWTVIAKRLEGAAQGDFVIALYNPKSGRRTQHIVEAQNILLRYRDPKTPVAIVKSGYRKLQQVQIVTLAEMADCDIGMLTTVLIGNSSTFVRAGLMVTPRGYANKYDKMTGEILSGEQAGRSLNMGLTGWHVCVRDYIRQTPHKSLVQIAHFFNCSLGEILKALSEATPEDEMIEELVVKRIYNEERDKWLDAARNWHKLSAVIENENGIIAEWFISGTDWKLEHNQFTIQTDHSHLTLDWTTVYQAWLVTTNQKESEIKFTDIHGRGVLNLRCLPM